jgi:hypothetical protein
MERVLETVNGPITAGELYPKLGELTDYIHQHRLALGETLGYLEFLTAMGVWKN